MDWNKLTRQEKSNFDLNIKYLDEKLREKGKTMDYYVESEEFKNVLLSRHTLTNINVKVK